ncbi:MAG: alkaline shock response membrane anchor protein AmaP [Kiritimatiellales bacterium]|nr:alkaline shock response membrane anchor protein AmaP [Kiritimatiellales bacterium]
MTNFFHRLSGLVIWFLFAVTGIALVHANIPGVTQNLFEFIPLHSLESAGIGGIVVLLSLLYLVTFGPRRPKVRYISFDSGEGSVSISVNAVRDYIRKLSGEFGAVVSIDPKIRAEKDNLSIDLNVNLVAGARIPELSQALQSRVRESLRDGLGIDEINEIKVRVQEITGDPRSVRHD